MMMLRMKLWRKVKRAEHVGHLNIVKELVEKVQQQGKNEALMTAIGFIMMSSKTRLKIVNILLEAGVDVNARTVSK